MGRRARLLREVGKFLAVGGVATLVSLFLFNFLLHGFSQSYQPLLADHAIVAYIVANVVGLIVSYRGNRSWVFSHRPPVHPDGGRTAFVVINVVTMGLPISCLWISRNVLGLADPISDNLSANVIGLALGTATRFYLYRTWVFRHPDAGTTMMPEFTAATEPSTSDPAPPPAP
jgi:putative flippase GtrA